MYQSLKDSFGGVGISRCLYQTLRLLLVINGTTRIIQRPIFPVKRFYFGIADALEQQIFGIMTFGNAFIIEFLKIRNLN